MKNDCWKLFCFVFFSLTLITVVALGQESDLLRQIEEVLVQTDREIARIHDEMEQLSRLPVPEDPRAAELHRLEMTIGELALELLQSEKKLFQEKKRLLLLNQNGKISAQEMNEQERVLSQSMRPERERWKQRMKAAQDRKAALESETVEKTP